MGPAGPRWLSVHPAGGWFLTMCSYLSGCPSWSYQPTSVDLTGPRAREPVASELNLGNDTFPPLLITEMIDVDVSKALVAMRASKLRLDSVTEGTVCLPAGTFLPCEHGGAKY